MVIAVMKSVERLELLLAATIAWTAETDMGGPLTVAAPAEPTPKSDPRNHIVSLATPPAVARIVSHVLWPPPIPVGSPRPPPSDQRRRLFLRSSFCKTAATASGSFPPAALRARTHLIQSRLRPPQPLARGQGCPPHRRFQYTVRRHEHRRSLTGTPHTRSRPARRLKRFHAGLRWGCRAKSRAFQSPVRGESGVILRTTPRENCLMIAIQRWWDTDSGTSAPRRQPGSRAAAGRGETKPSACHDRPRRRSRSSRPVPHNR